MMRLFTQRGGMFGLDARITLIIAVFIGLALGINQLRDIERHKITETNQRMVKVKQALLNYYKQNNGTWPANVTTLVTADSLGHVYLEQDDAVDAWNNNFVLVRHTFAGSHIDMPNTLFTSQTIYIFSSGPDEVFNDDYVGNYDGIGADEMVASMESLVLGDDLMIKLNSYTIDAQRASQGLKQLTEIRDKIESLASHNRLRWQRNCEGSGTGLSGCDYDLNGTYIQGEEQSMNFFPYATEVVGGCLAGRPFYADSASFSRSFTSGDLTSMQSLMTALGLPQSYARFGNVLRYDSNDGNRCSGPFNFKVWYN